MASQADILPVPKLVLTLVLTIAFTLLCVLGGQRLFYVFQDMENQDKIEESVPYEINVIRREQLNSLNEYRVTDKAGKKISIPIDDAMDLVRKDLATD